jgi:adenosylcobinamide kinase/adenosylcobinamide-phosphate guanylyltransferase
MGSSHLVLGGARSGKSRFAVASQPPAARVVFVATAEARDGDMAARIARHRADRPARWATVEEPYALVQALERLAGHADAVLVDCLTLWVANRMLRGDTDDAILGDADGIARLLIARRFDATLVTNEVGEGVHPETAHGLRFRDLLGLVNQRVAVAADRVTLMVAGLPLTIKAPAPPAFVHGPQTA